MSFPGDHHSGPELGPGSKPAPPDSPLGPAADLESEELHRTAEQPPPTPGSSRQKLFIGLLLVEGGLLVSALLLGLGGFRDPAQPLARLLTPEALSEALLPGLLATLPLVALIPLLHFWRPRFLEGLNQIFDEQLVPLFSECRWYDLALASLSAGIGEELFFRWAVQGGVAAWWGGPWGPWVGLLSASLLFGVCHMISPAYFWMTFAIGIYLGGVMLLTGSVVPPAIAHFVYDWVALVYLIQFRGSPPSSNRAHLPVR